MSIVADVLKALDTLAIWKRLQQVPEEVKALQDRVAALERRLEAASGDECPKCRMRAFTLQRSVPAPGRPGQLGLMQEHYACIACGHTDIRTRVPGMPQ